MPGSDGGGLQLGGRPQVDFGGGINRADLRPAEGSVVRPGAAGGGLLHGFLTGMDNQRTIEFAVAASCLKHTIPGDFNLVSVAEVEGLMQGDGSGRVQR